MEHHFHVGVVGFDVVQGGLDFGASDVGGVVEDLALEVGEFHHIKINDAEFAHAGQGQVHGRGGAEPAGADDEGAGGHHPALAGAADVLHDDVPAVAFDLFGGQAKGLYHWVASGGGGRIRRSDNRIGGRRRCVRYYSANIIAQNGGKQRRRRGRVSITERGKSLAGGASSSA